MFSPVINETEGRKTTQHFRRVHGSTSKAHTQTYTHTHAYMRTHTHTHTRTHTHTLSCESGWLLFGPQDEFNPWRVFWLNAEMLRETWMPAQAFDRVSEHSDSH